MTSKLEIACELLYSALFFYYEGNSYYACLQLAGGAEEILGAYVDCSGGLSDFKSSLNDTVKLSGCLDENGSQVNPSDITKLINLPKNSIKHMDDLTDSTVNFDAKAKAKEMLDRAVSNYYQLMTNYPLEETALIKRFNAQLVSVRVT